MGTITLNVGQLLWAFVAAMGIPGAIFGFLVWNFQRKITNQDKQREKEKEAAQKKAEEKERDREQLELFLIQSTNAAIALSEATARAVQRIPDAHCNGDMHDALEYAANTKHAQKDFLTQKGIQALL